MKWLIIIVGILSMAKGIWMIAWPQSASSFLKKWINMPSWLLKTVSIASFAFGVVCVVIAAAHADYKIAATLILGTIFIIAGAVYNSRETLAHICAPWIKGNKIWMGIWGFLSILFAVILLWIGFFK